METYEEFIQNILDTRGRFACGDEYHERHHIMPKSCGGTNDKENLIDLYAREHFKAHLLLALENPENDKLVYAWNMMCNSKHSSDYQIIAEEYEEARKAFSISMSGKNNPMYGKTHSEEVKQKISENNRNPSNETRKKMSESAKARCTEEWKRNVAERNKGRWAGENHPNYGNHNWAGENNPRYKNPLCGKENGRAKSVVQFTKDLKFIKIWNYITEAANELDIPRTTINGCCRGRPKTAGGYQWKYLYDQTQKDGTIIPGAITLGLIAEEEALRMLEEQETEQEN